MKLLRCPLNGPRPIGEFVHGGVAHPAVDPKALSDTAWAAAVFHEPAPTGPMLEWWCHVPTAYWFVAERDPRTDAVLRTFRPDPGAFGARPDPSGAGT